MLCVQADTVIRLAEHSFKLGKPGAEEAVKAATIDFYRITHGDAAFTAFIPPQHQDATGSSLIGDAPHGQGNDVAVQDRYSYLHMISGLPR